MIILQQTTLNQFDLFSLISSITSIILGIVAIVLSILFYLMSEKTGRENEKISTNIESNVKKLEDLFNKLYTGTFDMMKETVTDMRKHVYKSDLAINSTESDDKLINATLSSLSSEIENIKARKMDEKEIRNLIQEVLTKSRKIESDLKSDKVKEEMLSFLRVNGKVTYGDLDKYLRQKGLLTKNDSSLFVELTKLAEQGVTNDPFEKDSDGKKSISHSEFVFLLK